MARTAEHEDRLIGLGVSVQPEFLAMSNIAQKAGYQAALEFIVRRNPKLADHLLDNSFADGVFHCYDQYQRDLCLDLGIGLGNTCFNLARLFEEVVFVGVSSAGLEIQKAKARSDHVPNLRLLEAQIASLPFRDNEFDLIAADSLFEFIATSRGHRGRSVQVNLLRELWRILKPKGCLYVNARNRYGLLSWLSGRRPWGEDSLATTHCARSRSLDPPLVRFEKHSDSLRGYRSLMKEAGFGPIEFCWTSPFDTQPKLAGKLRDGNGYSFLVRYYGSNERDTSLRRLATFAAKLLPPRILQEICVPIWPTFLVFAWKHSKPRTVEDSISEETGATSLVRVSAGHGQRSKVIYVGLQDHMAKFFGKLSTCPVGRYLETEEELLSTYGGVNYEKRRFGSLTLFVERPIEGRRCVFLNPTYNRGAVDWLLQFQNKTISDTPACIERPGERAISALTTVDSDTRNSEETARQIKELGDILAHAHASACSEHGDFQPGNIFLAWTDEIYVMDWEFYRALGDPVFDFCWFIIVSSSRGGLKSFLENFSGAGPYSSVMSSIIRTFCREKRLPMEAILLGIPYTLSRWILRFSDYSVAPSPSQLHGLLSLLRFWNHKVQYQDFTWIS